MKEKTTTQVLKLAVEWHSGQKRKNGDDYITHPIRVAMATLDLSSKLNPSLVMETFQAALLHDVLEDKEGLTKETMSALDINSYVVTACDILNKKNYDNYFEYIMHCKENMISAVVKYCDICDNLVGLDPTEKNKRDKYLLSKYLIGKHLGID